MSFKFQIKKKNSAPLSGSLDVAEFGYDTAAKKVYIGNGLSALPSGMSMDGHGHGLNIKVGSNTIQLTDNKQIEFAGNVSSVGDKISILDGSKYDVIFEGSVAIVPNGVPSDTLVCTYERYAYEYLMIVLNEGVIIVPLIDVIDSGADVTTRRVSLTYDDPSTVIGVSYEGLFRLSFTKTSAQLVTVRGHTSVRYSSTTPTSGNVTGTIVNVSYAIKKIFGIRR